MTKRGFVVWFAAFNIVTSFNLAMAWWPTFSRCEEENRTVKKKIDRIQHYYGSVLSVSYSAITEFHIFWTRPPMRDMFQCQEKVHFLPLTPSRLNYDSPHLLELRCDNIWVSTVLWPRHTLLCFTLGPWIVAAAAGRSVAIIHLLIVAVRQWQLPCSLSCVNAKKCMIHSDPMTLGPISWESLPSSGLLSQIIVSCFL